MEDESKREKLMNMDDGTVKKFQRRTTRMIGRMAGIRGPSRKNKTVDEHIGRRVDEGPDPAGRIEVLSKHLVVEPRRSIPVMATCDVLVVGGGPAGLSAAIASARAGADTLLVERFGCFGGVITTVGMETLGWYRYEGTTDCEGIGIEMERIAAKMGGTVKWPFNESECLDADYFKIVADHLVRESGVRPLLHTRVVEAIMDGNTITGVITESKSGRMAILAKRVVDCSGDADVAYFAGARFRKTERASMMGVTTVFNVAGVDKAQFLDHVDNNTATYADWSKTWDQATTGKEDALASPYWEGEFEEAQQKGIIPKDLNSNLKDGKAVSLCGSWSALSDAGEATNLNLVHMNGYDGTNVHDLTEAEMEGRSQMLNALGALKGVVPGFGKAKLRNFGMTLGVRDTRKIKGRYDLTGKDVLDQARFKDSIGIFPEFVDGYSILVLPNSGRYFQVPYGCLQSPDVDNLLVGGRCVAGDRTSHAAMRNMMACTVTGQGCGAAAAVSVREGVSTGAVDIALVQEELRKQGVRLDYG